MEALFSRILDGGDGVFYRHEQKGDEDLTEVEKREILSRVFEESKPVFLQRYLRFALVLSIDSLHFSITRVERVIIRSIVVDPPSPYRSAFLNNANLVTIVSLLNSLSNCAFTDGSRSRTRVSSRAALRTRWLNTSWASWIVASRARPRSATDDILRWSAWRRRRVYL